MSGNLNEGFVKIHRKLFSEQSRYKLTDEEVSFWIKVIANVNYMDMKTKLHGVDVICPRGSSVFTYKSWSGILNITEKRVKTFFKKIINLGWIDVRTINKEQALFINKEYSGGSILEFFNGEKWSKKGYRKRSPKSEKKRLLVTICKYDNYQKKVDAKVFKSDKGVSPKGALMEYKKELSKDNPKKGEPFSHAEISPPHERKEFETSHEVKNDDKQKDKFSHEVEIIVEHLNLKTGRTGKRKLNPKSKSSKFIRGRLRDGFDVDDLKLVIDLKCDEWLGNLKMEKFLKVDTLFNPTNFEKYVDQLLESDMGKQSYSNLSCGDEITHVHLENYDNSDVLTAYFKSFDEDVKQSHDDVRKIVVYDMKMLMKANRGVYVFDEM